MPFKDIVEVMGRHVTPKPLVIAKRYKLQKCHQEEGQSIREFLAKLQKLAETCEFGTYRDEALSDRLVCGINSKVTRRKLLGEAESSLKKAVDIAVGLIKVVKASFETACKEVLGPKKYHHKDWISAETLSKIREQKEKKAAVNSSRTRAERSKALKEYSNAHKSTKKSIGADKREYIDGIAEAAEQAARAGNMKGLYDTTKKLA